MARKLAPMNLSNKKHVTSLNKPGHRSICCPLEFVSCLRASPGESGSGVLSLFTWKQRAFQGESTSDS
jgi:hypothetical protein